MLPELNTLQDQPALYWRPAALEFPPDLPIVARGEEIVSALRAHQTIIVCGATGSGKTTQLPKMCLAAGRGVVGRIACTQPRRIAARALATRIASELHTRVGEGVGYKVRFTDQVRDDSVIKVLTDGMLLAEASSQRDLREYDTIILDEAHERSLNIDFLLGYLHQLMQRRPELKLIIASATLDAQRFSRHFGDAPVIEVSGRTYPVEIRYRPVEAPVRNADESTPRQGAARGGIAQPDEDIKQAALLDAVDELGRLGDGGILVFLPGEREIREAAEALRKHHPPHVEILPLFARLSVKEQERIFQPGNARRIVLSTNLAETSLTVPGIRYVVDTGEARVVRYSLRNKIDQLQTEPVSQAAANQRAGRCGRVAAGVCIRLYSELDFQSRPAFTDPEILRTSLAGTILRMKSLGLGEPEDFPFLDAPTPRSIAEGFGLLEELGAVDAQRKMSALGKRLARLPLEPRIGRVLLAAQQFACLREALIICAALSVQDPRERPAAQAGSADDRHRAFADERSEFMGILKLWAFYDDALRHQKSRRQLQTVCQTHFLNPTRLREWREVHGQLAASVAELGMRESEEPASYEAIHLALLSGFPGNIGVKQDEGGYMGARGLKFHVHPGSVLGKKQPKWVMVAELMETTRLYGRVAAKIEPEWLERVAAHLCKRHYFDPHWEKSSAQVSAYEQVQLFGLIIIPRRKVHYGGIEPDLSRELFIRSALVAGEYDTHAAFFVHNRQLIESVGDLEHKARRQDVLIDDEALFAFFDARIPAGIVNGSGFERWRRDAERDTPRLLYLSRADVMRHDAESITEDWFPQTLQYGGIALPLRYRFEPGHLLDGVTVTLPLSLLNVVPAWQFEWLVPGMLREKLTWYLKNLPKHLRRIFVPVPDTVTAVMSGLRAEGALVGALAQSLSARSGLVIGASDWRESPPSHLLMNVCVVDDAGKELGMGRDVLALRAQLGSAAQLVFAEADTTFERGGFKQWTFGDVPQSLPVVRAGARVQAYPAIVDEGGSVALRLFDTLPAAEAAHRAGLVRLFRFALRAQFAALEKDLPDFTRLALAYRPLGSAEALREMLLAVIAEQACLAEGELPREARQFEQQVVKARVRLRPVTDALCRTLGQILHLWQQIVPQVNKVAGPSGRDMQTQLRELIYPGFVAATTWSSLQHLPRYLQGLQWRIDKLPERRQQDERHTASLVRLITPWQMRHSAQHKNGIPDSQLDNFRWQLEELRISLFAQQLKTPVPVSVKRLEKLWGMIVKG
ncbi:MAG: ATP-dependent RNA helicase HrpA [Betaproteobacteria bacterium]|nr:ATP-dependent RNA helicase HrpA [Betaproteobacteria bacterium]